MILAKGVYPHQIIVGTINDKIKVIDYWENKGVLEHNLLIYNSSGDSISVSATIIRIDNQTLKSIESEQYLKKILLTPNAFTVLNYPDADKKGRYLNIVVNGYSAGMFKLDMSEPAVDIPENRFVTKCNRHGTHINKMWFVFKELIVPYSRKIKFSVFLECRKKSRDPKYLLVSQTNTKIRRKKDLVIRKYEDNYDHTYDKNEYDLIIEYPIGEFGHICYGSFEVTLDNIQKQEFPFSPQFVYRIIKSSEIGGGIPLIIE